ncbi:unnamed protein product [Rhizoctonia solani]|uniref:BTB domain-containing protein n=1 Tax=Rhizoctonia solani TaxID=456999 RepID=A0A8H3D2V8_9AGAM|nr:unnamed protein product [Rhizoctonia solani]
MSTSHSENHYFTHGDVTLLVENILFKLHRDVLEIHSEYFQSLLNVAETVEGQATSNEQPLVLSADLCSAKTFELICDFMYPKAIGVYPAILIQEVEKWEAALQAAASLQMRGLRVHILTEFQGKIATNPTSAARLLGLAVGYDEAPNSLKLQCLYALVFLRRAVSSPEVACLGEGTTSQVVAIRDRIRILIATSPTYWSTIHRHYLCMEGPNCQTYIHEGVFNNIKNTDPLQEYYQTDASIFEIPQDNRICFQCSPIRTELASTMAKQELEGEIRRCALGLGLLRVED